VEREELFDRVFGPLFENAVLRLVGRSPLSVFSLGIPPSQHGQMMAEAQGRDVLGEYRRRARRLICGWPLDDNPFAWQALCRGYDRQARRGVPDYLKPEHYATIKARAGRVSTRLASTVDALAAAAPGEFNAFVFLDSQDWMPPALIERQWRAVARVGGPGARVIFRTAAAGSPIEGALPPELLARFEYHREESAGLFAQDRSAIYGGFHLYTVRG
jgi:S-adenosylmethionine-diacylglycerol 3-amino-3-carboxypropyl transferase